KGNTYLNSSISFLILLQLNIPTSAGHLGALDFPKSAKAINAPPTREHTYLVLILQTASLLLLFPLRRHTANSPLPLRHRARIRTAAAAAVAAHDLIALLLL